jgi:hypothetical protein
MSVAVVMRPVSSSSVGMYAIVPAGRSSITAAQQQVKRTAARLTPEPLSKGARKVINFAEAQEQSHLQVRTCIQRIIQLS